MSQPTPPASETVKRAAVLLLILVSFPLILAVDLYLTPWRLPVRILYAIPILLAARLFANLTVTLAVVLTAIAFTILDARVAGVDVATEAVTVAVLILIGTLSVLWANAERRAQVLAEERSRLLEQEQRRAAELEDSRARLREFFSLVSHELRGPLTVIGGYTQMLSRYDTLTPAQRERIANSAASAVRHIYRLSDDLLDASRIGVGRFEVSKRRCDLVALAKDAVAQRQPSAPNHRLILEGRVETLEVACDADRISQVIGNLVDNAVKYSPSGGEVRVVVERGDRKARVSVSDQGIGIAAEDVPRLFQPYVRLRRGPETRGLGLGLYIVKGIVDAHEGGIRVQSELGKGSTFVVDLPLDDPAACQASPTPYPADRTSSPSIW